MHRSAAELEASNIAGPTFTRQGRGKESKWWEKPSDISELKMDVYMIAKLIANCPKASLSF